MVKNEHDMVKGLIIASYILGLLCATMAILRSRTPQGAIAWVMSLLSFPFFSVPVYLLMGRNRFDGYNSNRRFIDQKIQDEIDEIYAISPTCVDSSDEMKVITKLVTHAHQPAFTCKNKIKLLIDADETFPEILKEMESATKYIIFQFYVVRGDTTGRMFFDVLIRKAREGVKVTFMNDAIGVIVPKEIMREMLEAGVQIGTFNQSTHKGKLQINFRNHRKVVIVDGRVAFLGGLNIGDEYRGLKKEYGPWRDTNVRIEGPSVLAAQLSVAKDWYFIHEKPLEVSWDIQSTDGDAGVMVLHSGPADERHNSLLSFIALINSAKERLWIANPYYVPPESLMDAVLLARLRGVDVRILIPSYSDARFVMLASRVYQKQLLNHDVKVFRYSPGFLHQKVMIVDNRFAVVGSSNFDCRSMFINFEINVMTTDRTFVENCVQMLARDFTVSEEIHLDEFKNVPLTEQIVTRGANLLAPVL